MTAAGNVLKHVGILGTIAVFLLTIYFLFAAGDVVLAVLAIFVPPADFVLAFVVNPALGVAALATAGVAIAGVALEAAGEGREQS